MLRSKPFIVRHRRHFWWGGRAGGYRYGLPGQASKLAARPHQPKAAYGRVQQGSSGSTVIRYVREGWPQVLDSEKVKYYRKLKDSLSAENGRLFHCQQIVIPQGLRSRVLDLIHLGYSGMQRTKQMARTAFYWPRICDNIEQLGHACLACAEHQRKPSKPENHPWILCPEADCTWIMLSIFLDQTGWCWWVPTPTTPASTQPVLLLPRLQPTYWSKISLTLDIPMRWWRMLLPSNQKNSRLAAKSMVLPTLLEPRTILQRMELPNAWCRLFSNHCGSCHQRQKAALQ